MEVKFNKLDMLNLFCNEPEVDEEAQTYKYKYIDNNNVIFELLIDSYDETIYISLYRMDNTLLVRFCIMRVNMINVEEKYFISIKNDEELIVRIYFKPQLSIDVIEALRSIESEYFRVMWQK